jgi:hypothetical protein
MLWMSMLEFREGAHSLMRMNFPALETEQGLATFHGRRWAGCEMDEMWEARSDGGVSIAGK